MKQQVLLLTAVAVAIAVPGLAATQTEGLAVDLAGSMRVQIGIPLFIDDVDLTTPVTAGRADLAYRIVTPGVNARFWLNQVNLNFADFSFSRTEPIGTQSFRSIGVRLARPVAFDAAESPAGVYTFTLPPEAVTIFGAVLVNGNLKAGEDPPTEDVTGTIDLNANTFTARVVMHQEDEFAGLDVGGPLTVNLTGTIRRPTAPDADGDGVPDAADNCVLVANPGQQPIPSPVVIPPPTAHLGNCLPLGFGTATAVDVCDGAPVTLTHDAPAKLPVGVTTVTWTGRTGSGRTATATQDVIVADIAAPVFLSVPPAITVHASHRPWLVRPHGHFDHHHHRDGDDEDDEDRHRPPCRDRECVRFIDIGLAAAADDCGAGTPIVTHDAPRRFRFGTTTVTWTARDAAGNRATATQTVTVLKCRHRHHGHGHHHRHDRHDNDRRDRDGGRGR